MPQSKLSSRHFRTLNPLSRSEIRKLAHHGREIHYSRGSFIFRERERGDAVYVLLRGTIQVLKTIRGKGQVALRTLRPGSLFGEMSLFTGKRRSAACQAIQPAVVLEIPHARFRKLIREGDAVAYKLIHASSRMLAERLNHVLELIGSDSFATSVENPMFLRKMKFFWSV